MNYRYWLSQATQLVGLLIMGAFSWYAVATTSQTTVVTVQQHDEQQQQQKQGTTQQSKSQQIISLDINHPSYAVQNNTFNEQVIHLDTLSRYKYLRYNLRAGIIGNTKRFLVESPQYVSPEAELSASLSVNNTHKKVAAVDSSGTQ